MRPVKTYGTGAKVILSVEDDDAAFLLMQLGFKDVGGDFRLYRALDGEQALAFLERAGEYRDAPKPDLVLLNLNLPRLRGDEVLTAIKADPALSGISTVVFSSSHLDRDRARCLALGARDFITKPTDLDDFLRVLHQVCQ